ncbi:hypothetical protein EYC79_18225 [Agrobacterium cavarae]|uniref:Uncharacterized protein n=1 Tax=Agrobacterium cavarae TaxID=2528239 RepID=A0ABY1Y6M4_9HYPH|nr:hypothetical protein [Agrobacterium cavarae]TBN10887.1 hypothetical protein EYC79_18225 [Agrobacterium cavarae]
MSFLLPTSLTGRVCALIICVLLSVGGFRLWLSFHDAALLEGYVLLSEKTAAEAKAAEMERQRNAAALALEENRKRALADALIQQQAEAKQEQAIKDDNQNMDDGDYRWSDDDRRWLCEQRGEAYCRR